ncbi:MULTISPECIES: hypothetical protein [Burkholderia]|uniref:hypothetical protein n=1 Tax=Burkholderia TaxID=32008 RepID=UPI0012D2FDFA|nr:MULTISPECIES: hypothetical protein [Burkholderia]
MTRQILNSIARWVTSFAFLARVDVRRFVRDGWLYPPPHRDVLVEAAHRRLHDRAVVVKRDDRVVAVAGDLVARLRAHAEPRERPREPKIHRARGDRLRDLDELPPHRRGLRRKRRDIVARDDARVQREARGAVEHGLAPERAVNGCTILGEWARRCRRDAASRARYRSYGDCGASRSTVRSAVSNGVA